MKKSFKYYLIVWAVMAAVFNMLVFLPPYRGAGKFSGSFWTGYLFVMIAFLVQLGCAWYALNTYAKKLFLRIPLLSVSVASLAVMFIVGSICMVIPGFPLWLGVLLCGLVLAFSVISLVKAQAAGDIVEESDAGIKNNTFFIKALTVEMETLMERAASAELKSEVKKVYEAVRYSDAVSMEALSGLEAQITLRAAQLTEEVNAKEIEEVKKISSEMLLLISERNKKCKLLK